MIKGAIFDIDGTVLDSMPIWEDAAERYLKKMGNNVGPELGDILYAMSLNEGAQWLKLNYLPNLDVDEIIMGINRTIENFYQNQVLLKNGVARFLTEMRQAKIRMVAATSCERSVVELALIRLNVMDFFERVFTCSEIGVGKTDPAIYLTAADYLSANPPDIWVFEDALFAIRTARLAGFMTVGVYDSSSQNDWEEIMKESNISLEKLDSFHGFIKRASRLN